MKKLSLLLLTLTVCFFSACHNSIWDAIEDLDGRVTKLEELCKEMNTNITSLQTIVSVLQSNDYITGIVEIKKNGEVIGYTITFGKHDPITIYHGQDGKDGQNGADGKDGQNGQNGADGKDGQDGVTPIIGIAQDTDGVYYWTLNGEWLLDDNGNKLPVSGTNGKDGQNGSNGQDGTDGKDGQDGTDGKDGQDGADGKDGVTPQLKIEDGYWYISYDNGATWTQLGKATGEDGKDGADGKDGQNGADGKDGQDGDSMFQSVTQDENFVYFTLADGTVIKIAKGSSSDNRSEGQLSGVFSVSRYDKINFSQGNLLYNPALDVWKFADKQSTCYNRDYTSVSQNSNLWIDLLLWGATGYLGTTPFGANIPVKIEDTDLWFISAANFDYGVYCPIENGGNKSGLWRTLTLDEWLYLLNERQNASSLKTIGFVNNVEGLILLPDTSSLALKNPNILVNGLKYTDETWGELESKGCVFLPYTENYWTYDAYVSVDHNSIDCRWHTFRGDAIDCRKFSETFLYGNDYKKTFHVRLVKDL